jgi:hypothetical protein
MALLRGITPRGKSIQNSPFGSGYALSRRSFLALSGVGVAMGALPRFLRGEGFEVVRDEHRVHVLSGGIRRWTVDPYMFGERARVDVKQGVDEVAIRLSRALFPATQIPADFTCKFSKESGSWAMRLKMVCGIEASSPLQDWLLQRNSAIGLLKAVHFTPVDGLTVEFQSAPAVLFNPDWTLILSGPSTITVRGLTQSLSSSGVEVLLNSDAILAGSPVQRSTTFIVPRGAERWPIDISRGGELGWSLEHDLGESLFDELRIESADTDAGVLRSALLLQSRNGGSSLNFQPGGALCTDCGEPFQMPLENPRLAISLEEAHHSALVADLAEGPVWAHDSGASYLLEKSSDAPHFELHQDHENSAVPQVSPAICEVCFPSDDVCMNLKLGVPRPVSFTWADLFAPFARFLGWLHLVPTHDEHGKLYIDLQKGDALYVDRPRDLLSLQFHFENMRLCTGAFPRIVHIHGSGEPRVSVVFPPQHAAEEAYFHTDPGFTKVDIPIGEVERDDYANKPTDPTPTIDDLKKTLDPDFGRKTSELDKDLPPILLSGETHLVFTLPRHHDSIACHPDALLDWKHWQPVIAPVAQTHIDESSPETLPKIASPSPDLHPYLYTSIELPYRLNLSPSELGRWAHSIKPVESPKKQWATKT